MWSIRNELAQCDSIAFIPEREVDDTIENKQHSLWREEMKHIHVEIPSDFGARMQFLEALALAVTELCKWIRWKC